ncbi:hypothetical protein ACFVRU_40450, partial [Streptomyces sp. NPDC057927]
MAEFDEVMRFEVLGPLRVRRAERELDLGFPQQRALLGLLMVRAGRPVQVSEIVARHFGPDAELPRIDVERILQLGMESYAGGEP